MRSRSTLTALLATIVAAVLTACSSSSGSGSDLESVKQAGVLRVATEGTYSPFSFHDPKTNALTGYDVEVAKAVADKLGVKVEYVETPWDAISKGAGAQVESVEGFTQAITLLKQSRVDATVNDSLAVLDYQKSTGDQTVRIAAKTGDVSEQAVATRKGSDLVAAIDTALADLEADGTLAKISEKYFSADVSKQPAGASSS